MARSRRVLPSSAAFGAIRGQFLGEWWSRTGRHGTLGPSVRGDSRPDPVTLLGSLKSLL